MDKYILTNKLYDISNYYALYLYTDIKIIINKNKKFKFYDIKSLIGIEIEEWINDNNKLLSDNNINFIEISHDDPIIHGYYTDLKNINMILILFNITDYIDYISNKIFDAISDNFIKNKMQYIEIIETKNKYNDEVIKLEKYTKMLAYEKNYINQ
ncbi:hypothetical protein AMV206 [Betaentomopoxvirus amoorei]|uniref:AMV206 n=1 Tax=Amsacta moorei entomopoxvirus TaxID=28321 RepID=Q9EMK0_AMEPV|nr:hypothetical protein AMV206 [Amsacta moorei entomopoxvirus]AAG02912.1 AMV206 [Amsacta moorei entomopoxvirus]